MLVEPEISLSREKQTSALCPQKLILQHTWVRYELLLNSSGVSLGAFPLRSWSVTRHRPIRRRRLRQLIGPE